MSCQSAPGRTDHLETRALPEGPGVSRGGPMRCPWYLFFIGFFFFWARTQGPHDPLLPGGP
ncbi:unnamed protein product, partial [Staurois parvus]